MSNRGLCWGISTLALLGSGLEMLAVQADQQQICSYDPTLGEPNPLGMRAYVTITVEADTVAFTYEQFPGPVGDGSEPITLATARTLTFYQTDLEQARQRLVNSPELYGELLGSDPLEGFAALNQLITCRAPEP